MKNLRTKEDGNPVLFLILQKKGCEQMKENIATGVAGGLFGLILAAAIASWQVIVVVATIYAVGLFANLTTGLLYAHQTDSYSQEIARHAIYRKGGAIVGILALFMLDLLIMGVARYYGVVYDIPFFGAIFTSYNAVHEFRSMLENIKKLGNKIPKVLEDAANKAGNALDQGKIPDIGDVIKSKGDTDEGNK